MSAAPLELRGRLSGQDVMGRVVEMTRRGLAADVSLAEAPAAGTELEEATIFVDGEPAAALPGLRLVGGRPRGAAYRLAFETSDAGAQEELWKLLELEADAPPGPEPPRIPGRGLYTEEARHERLRWLAARSGSDLDALAAMRLKAERLTGNVENLVGAVEVPVGLAGPLHVKGRFARGIVYAPFATTEGALVASATRGATALTRAGGVTVRVVRQHMMRVPLFVMESLDGTLLFSRWVSDHLPELRDRVKEVSRHAELLSVEPIVMGKLVHLHFLYETADAAGQNMTTACTWHACQWIMRELGRYRGIAVEQFFIEGNVSGDKKVSFRSFIAGRGIRVVAECLVPRDVLGAVLKVTPEQLAICHTWAQAGSIHAGMVGFNFNVANVVAAIFTATGQDIACVHESSVAELQVQGTGEGVYASLMLPSLIVGTVGGGTHLPAQQALLEMMGCAGPGKVLRLAEIVAAFCLALDLSTMAAGASGQFASAHERLGRNRPVAFLTRDDVGPRFFEPMLRRAFDDPGLTVAAVTPLARRLGSSIITELTARRSNKLVGLFPLRLEHTRGPTDVLLKVKPTDEEIGLMGATMAEMCGGTLATAYRRFRDRLDARGCHVRELAVYAQTDPRFVAHAPRVYGIHRDDAREAHLLVLELLEDVELMDSADDAGAFTPAHVAAAIAGLAEVHAVWLGREEELRRTELAGPARSTISMVEMADLFDALASHAHQEHPELVDAAALERLRSYGLTLATWWPRLDAMRRTLVHNDANPRNLAFRRTPDGPRLVLWDWELAALHVPQRDVAELLAFVLAPDTPRAALDACIEAHRAALERASGHLLDPAAWRLGFALALRHFAIDRLGLYLMAHTFRHYAFLPRVVATTLHLLDLVDG